MDSNLLRTKSIEQLVGDAEHGGKSLKRTLTATDLTLLGIGAIIGTGIFVLTGTAAANQAGPGIVLSYVIAGLACGFAALCYAEFAAMIPIAGSAYTYAYATLGEIFAWMIGWDLILEYAVGSMTVAVGWSGYFQRILAGFEIHLPTWMMAAPSAAEGAVLNLPAILIVLAIMVVLVIGVRESARFNALMVTIKLAAVAFFIVMGITYVKPENWTPFMPYGFSGVMTGAAVVFFAYIGFDAVSTTAEEAKNPSRDLPIGIIASLIICTVLYLVVAAILTGILPVVAYKNDVQFLNAPVGYALAVINKDWAAGLVSAGAVAGITSVLLVMLMSQPRIFFSMSRDQLLPAGVSKVHPRFRTPYITTIITCVIVAVVAGFVPIQILGEMTSIGTLFAFVVVSIAVIILRIKRPDARRPFRVPFGFVIPVLGVIFCVYLMVSLSVMTWVRFLGWLDLGMIIYWTYGRVHSPLVDRAEASARSAAEGFANLCKILGFMLLFNGFAITLLAYLTEFGVTNETLAKWSELDAVLQYVGMHINPEIADAFGWKILLGGAVLTALGFVLARSSSKR
ncbi:MAG: amino acid permease [Acidobacteria bacterium RIFCSPLOWO2_02_FULL_67_36]|nr:MAG: amino acid permease [Acidobacteria bacterium RIFCSPLOWO2_02_FULL_67_36]OFW18461.1 MAG: amino acid permease [Acidobacteria bacterium RIFCSPLOWO2_12_FULL_66_21]